MRTPNHSIYSEKIHYDIKIALLSDVHDGNVKSIEKCIEKIEPDLVVAPGDICENIIGDDISTMKGLELLRWIAKDIPVFYSLGNHELGRQRSSKKQWMAMPTQISPYTRDLIRKSGAVLLDDEYINWNGLCIGGLTSGLRFLDGKPYTDWLDRFCQEPGYKVLLSHHPEYFDSILNDERIDLIVSGHAHGGHWRIGNQGVFAPGQGLFPKYSRGFYQNRMIVSAGVGNNTVIPRLFNPLEIPVIHLQKKR